LSGFLKIDPPYKFCWNYGNIVVLLADMSGCERPTERRVRHRRTAGAIALSCLTFAAVACDNSPSTEVAADNAAASPTAEPSTAPVDRFYGWGVAVKCGRGGQSERYNTLGWSDAEKDFTWTIGKRTELLFRTEPTAKALQLRMRLAGNTKPPQLPFQPVEVYVNQQKVADWEVGDSADYTATIPAGTVKEGGELRIELKVPQAASPKSLEVSAEPRVLGVCCWEYEISEI
jgi:hypothetical protein